MCVVLVIVSDDALEICVRDAFINARERINGCPKERTKVSEGEFDVFALGIWFIRGDTDFEKGFFITTRILTIFLFFI